MATNKVMIISYIVLVLASFVSATNGVMQHDSGFCNVSANYLYAGESYTIHVKTNGFHHISAVSIQTGVDAYHHCTGERNHPREDPDMCKGFYDKYGGTGDVSVHLSFVAGQEWDGIQPLCYARTSSSSGLVLLRTVNRAVHVITLPRPHLFVNEGFSISHSSFLYIQNVNNSVACTGGRSRPDPVLDLHIEWLTPVKRYHIMTIVDKAGPPHSGPKPKRDILDGWSLREHSLAHDDWSELSTYSNKRLYVGCTATGADVLPKKDRQVLDTWRTLMLIDFNVSNATSSINFDQSRLQGDKSDQSGASVETVRHIVDGEDRYYYPKGVPVHMSCSITSRPCANLHWTVSAFKDRMIDVSECAHSSDLGLPVECSASAEFTFTEMSQDSPNATFYCRSKTFQKISDYLRTFKFGLLFLELKSETATATIPEGGEGVLECPIYGNPYIEYTWYIPSESDTPKLDLGNGKTATVQPFSFTTVRCRGHNPMINKTMEATIDLIVSESAPRLQISAVVFGSVAIGLLFAPFPF